MRRLLIAAAALLTMVTAATAAPSPTATVEAVIQDINAGNVNGFCQSTYLGTGTVAGCAAYYEQAGWFAPITALRIIGVQNVGGSEAYVYAAVASEGQTATLRFALMKPRGRWVVAGWTKVIKAKTKPKPVHSPLAN